jgi:molybdopterin molybdotransferase
MVTREPRVALLTTGDELVPVEAPLTPGKIHDANSYTLAGLVRSAGAIPIVLPPASDHLDAVRDLFREALALKPDMVVSSAGVSVGAADFVRTVLDELGEVDFWRINLRPGKPLAFGLLRATETPGAPVPFFGLPGNPVSAMVTFEVLVRPALRQMLGLPPQTPTVRAICAEDTTSDGRRSYLRVRLREEAGALRAYSTGTQSSGALSSLVEADGLMIVPEDVRFVAAGTAVEVITLS